MLEGPGHPNTHPSGHGAASGARAKRPASHVTVTARSRALTPAAARQTAFACLPRADWPAADRPRYGVKASVPLASAAAISASDMPVRTPGGSGAMNSSRLFHGSTT